jgi:Class II flagellar assembly regulator
MRIEDRSRVQNNVQGTQSRKATDGTRFVMPSMAETTTQVSSARATTALTSLDALLTLQGVDDFGERRKRVVKRGNTLLDRLENLKIGLLEGRLNLENLSQLNALLKSGVESTGDPRLDDLMGHIELRAAVEMAKLTRPEPDVQGNPT